jgi:hypothetical protein
MHAVDNHTLVLVFSYAAAAVSVDLIVNEPLITRDKTTQTNIIYKTHSPT